MLKFWQHNLILYVLRENKTKNLWHYNIVIFNPENEKNCTLRRLRTNGWFLILYFYCFFLLQQWELLHVFCPYKMWRLDGSCLFNNLLSFFTKSIEVIAPYMPIQNVKIVDSSCPFDNLLSSFTTAMKVIAFIKDKVDGFLFL